MRYNLSLVIIHGNQVVIYIRGLVCQFVLESDIIRFLVTLIEVLVERVGSLRGIQYREIGKDRVFIQLLAATRQGDDGKYSHQTMFEIRFHLSASV